jgi:hypothetical protein
MFDLIFWFYPPLAGHFDVEHEEGLSLIYKLKKKSNHLFSFTLQSFLVNRQTTVKTPLSFAIFVTFVYPQAETPSIYSITDARSFDQTEHYYHLLHMLLLLHCKPDPSKSASVTPFTAKICF